MSETETWLTPAQRRTVAVAVTVLSVAAIALAVAWVCRLLVLFFAFFAGVFTPVAVAGVLALVLKPYYEWLRRRLRLRPVFAVGAVYVSVCLPVCVFAWFFGALLCGQLSDFAQRIPSWWAHAREALRQRWPDITALWNQYDLGHRLGEVFRQHGDLAGKALGALTGTAFAAGKGIAQFLAGLLGWVVLPVYLAFFLMAPPVPVARLEGALPFLKPETRHDVLQLAREFVAILVSFFRGQLVIAFAQGVLLGLGFWAVGLTYGLTLGLVLGFLNIVPYLGSMLTLLVALPLALFQADGGWGTLLLVVAVIVAVQLVEGYLLTPRIMGRRMGLPPMVIMVAIFFWGTALDGLMGMILAIPLTTFFFVLWRLAKAKYIREIV